MKEKEYQMDLAGLICRKAAGWLEQAEIEQVA